MPAGSSSGYACRIGSRLLPLAISPTTVAHRDAEPADAMFAAHHGGIVADPGKRHGLIVVRSWQVAVLAAGFRRCCPGAWRPSVYAAGSGLPAAGGQLSPRQQGMAASDGRHPTDSRDGSWPLPPHPPTPAQRAARPTATNCSISETRRAVRTTPLLQTTAKMVILLPSEFSLLTPHEAMASVKPWRTSHPLVS